MTTYPSTTAPRRRRGRRSAALALAGAASAMLVFAGSANATIYRPADGDELQANISAANVNPGADTIILANTFYSTTLPQTISDNLTIAGDHSFQTDGSGPAIDGTSVSPPESDSFTVTTGTTLRMHGFTYQGSSSAPFTSMKVAGTAIFDNMSIVGHTGRAIETVSGGSVTLNNTSLDQNLDIGIIVGGNSTVVLNNSSVLNSVRGGIANQQGGTLRLNNSIVALNRGNDCFGAGANTTIRSLDSEGPVSQCNVALHANPNLEFSNLNGGPTFSQNPNAGSPVINAGDSGICPTTDQRFFVRPVGACDIGPYEDDAVRDTTAPSCDVTAVRAGPPKQQDVTLRDGASGIGNDGVRPEEVTITNGTVAFTPFASPFRSPATAPPPSNGGLVLTATKTDQSMSTRWSFLARDWAGNQRNCT